MDVLRHVHNADHAIGDWQGVSRSVVPHYAHAVYEAQPVFLSPFLSFHGPSADLRAMVEKKRKTSEP